MCPYNAFSTANYGTTNWILNSILSFCQSASNDGLKMLKRPAQRRVCFHLFFKAFSQLVAKSICPVSFCMLSDSGTANIIILPVHMTAWQPLIHLHFSVIFQRWNWEALRLHRSGTLEDSMYPHYLIWITVATVLLPLIGPNSNLVRAFC